VRATLRTYMRYTLVMILASIISGCSTARSTCQAWIDAGEIFSPMSRCIRCVDELGSKDLHTIRGCAFGLDAASVIGSSSDSGK